MKVHYINILLFAFPLNVLVHYQRNHMKTILHKLKTEPTKTHRTLCDCELYTPSNYENDPEMKELMENFNRQTSERFRQYDERVQYKRKQCKEQCDKDIQKIILKDKIGKQMAKQFSSLENNINNNDIPTCVCEKSIADRTEKFCLKCGYEIGGGMLQSFGLLGGIGEVALNAWKSGALLGAEKAAIAEGVAKGAVAGETAGKKVIIEVLQKFFFLDNLNGTSLQSFFNSTPYTAVTKISSAIDTQMYASCDAFSGKIGNEAFCGLRKTLNIVATPGKQSVEQKTALTKAVTQFVEKAKLTAKIQAAEVSSETSSKILTKQTALIEAGFDSSTTSIYASIIVILIIVLIMVIIYLILRYRRKKKMKKKLQYIKLLEE
ncbi:rifin [Plasmodium sp. gorilla clade G1]|nr:rifin [Plasmodium sp. gorilla clade G1]